MSTTRILGLEVELEIQDEGNFKFTVPDCIDNGDTIQQVTIEDGVGDPVSKETLNKAIQDYVRNQLNEDVL